jgi:hypothetical protein
MFEGWDSFFLLIGGAAGALIGLLFVVASIPTGGERQVRLQAASLYISPTVFHLAIVMVVSGTALAPRLPAPAVSALVGVCALIGLIHLACVAHGILSPKTPAPPHWSDIWCYGVGPLVLYAVLGGAAIAEDLTPRQGAYAIAGASLALLLLAIRNAWDLVTWLAPARDGSSGLST